MHAVYVPHKDHTTATSTELVFRETGQVNVLSKVGLLGYTILSNELTN